MKRLDLRSFALRRRIAALVAIAVAAGVLLVSAGAWLETRQQLRSQVDSSLVAQGSTVTRGRLIDPRDYDGTPAALLALSAPFELVYADGSPPEKLRSQRLTLPVDGRDVAVARGQRGRRLRDLHVGSQHLRLVTLPYAPGVALVVAADLDPTDRALHRLAVLLVLVSAAGTAAAAGAGVAVARAGLRPVRELTAAAERVARTDDLGAPIALRGDEPADDEVARLARSFNTMLAALALSRQRQGQLVADAGHELRTPLTSLRTNLELLAREDPAAGRMLAPADRARLLADLTAQVSELTTLVGELTALAREEGPEQAYEPVDLAVVTARAVERVRRRAGSVLVHTELAPSPVLGQPWLLERAVTNLLDNAVKWSPPDGQVFVGLGDGALVVADQGPGIDEQDLPHVFERFYRAAAAREQPGSGLGLAIVAQAAREHGGTASAERGPQGGTVMRLTIPVTGSGHHSELRAAADLQPRELAPAGERARRLV